jgi:hypothetical protein
VTARGPLDQVTNGNCLDDWRCGYSFRTPSEQVLNALADSLQLSADILRETAEDVEQAQRTRDAIAADTDLTTAQRRALTEAYEAMRQVTASRSRGSRRSK